MRIVVVCGASLEVSVGCCVTWRSDVSSQIQRRWGPQDLGRGFREPEVEDGGREGLRVFIRKGQPRA